MIGQTDERKQDKSKGAKKMAEEQTEIWDIWYPKAAATGISFARGRVAAGVETMLVHSAPETLTVTVCSGDGTILAQGSDLEASDDTPIARLTRQGKEIRREDIWPRPSDVGQLVLLPGGEAGVLKAWWHAEDRSEWRWQIELYNHR